MACVWEKDIKVYWRGGDLSAVFRTFGLDIYSQGPRRGFGRQSSNPSVCQSNLLMSTALYPMILGFKTWSFSQQI